MHFRNQSAFGGCCNAAGSGSEGGTLNECRAAPKNTMKPKSSTFCAQTATAAKSANVRIVSN